jgi:serine/threonine protein phosphatase PrpC
MLSGLVVDTAKNLKMFCLYILGGYISESQKDLKVNGILSATRGLGNHGDPKLKKCVPFEPYTTSVPIDQYAQFLILATKGVWEVFSEEEAATLVCQVSLVASYLLC